MNTPLAVLVTALVTTASIGAQSAEWMRDWRKAQTLKPARVSSSERIAPVNEPGTPLTVRGRVLLPSGDPAAGIEIFAYHTDHRGIYAPEGAADPWRLKGWAVTDPQGRFEFHTIRPGSYPAESVPAHIHITLVTKCCGRQSSELMFEDDPLVTKAYRERERTIDIKQYGKVERAADGSQVTSCTIRLRTKGDF